MWPRTRTRGGRGRSSREKGTPMPLLALEIPRRHGQILLERVVRTHLEMGPRSSAVLEEDNGTAQRDVYGKMRKMCDPISIAQDI
eukprot:477623-Pyramimonas_sp.AAC.1